MPTSGWRSTAANIALARRIFRFRRCRQGASHEPACGLAQYAEHVAGWRNPLQRPGRVDCVQANGEPTVAGGSLEWAIRHRQLVVHYQPIAELATRQCVGVEALVRWRQDGHNIAPDVFIPLVEEHGLIQRLTDLVLDKTLEELRTHLRANPAFYVSLNVSAEDMRTDRFLRLLTSRLECSGIAPGQIRIEVTERSFMDADVFQDMIAAFRRAGHPIYLDDFGTGYSSLSYLQNFKVDALKIDKSFVDTIDQDTASSPVALHIIRMAQDLGLNVVAEGIELDSQARYLALHKVRYGQGWFFAKPMPARDLFAYLRHQISENECRSAVESLSRTV